MSTHAQAGSGSGTGDAPEPRIAPTHRESRGTGPDDSPDGGSRGLRGSLRRHPLTWFFALAFGLSWVAWTPYVLGGNGLGVLGFTFPGGLAGGQLLGMLPGAYLGPILSALLVTAATEGRPGLRAWAGRLTKWRVGWRWYVGVIVAVPAVLTVTATVVGGDSPVVPGAVALAGFVPGLIMQMVTTGLAEEPGWRDFAMPIIQRRSGALLGSLVVGLLWGLWHLPLFLTEWAEYPDVAWWEPVEFVATTIAFSLVMTWVFNRTGQSLPVTMLLHVGVNNFNSVLWSDMFPELGREHAAHTFLVSSVVVAAVLLIATRGRLGYEPAPDTVPS
ncbi:type II CAAX endopeptidase family protein [Streptomyces sp. NPDC000351]|uniref:type II CAAX endopeptidase family protein n=1 Tax=Streptomyces sp. NPDC000351 TaxID=3154250 RepID=UPI003330382B